VKFDGYRLQIHKTGKNVTLYSRNGNDFTSRFPEISRALALLPTKAVVLDAELIACRDDGSPDFSALLHRQDTPLCVSPGVLLARMGTFDLEPILRPRFLRKAERRLEIALMPGPVPGEPNPG
jgi:bifunctional non-homologous end joining protein LigD